MPIFFGKINEELSVSYEKGAECRIFFSNCSKGRQAAPIIFPLATYTDISKNTYT